MLALALEASVLRSENFRIGSCNFRVTRGQAIAGALFLCISAEFLAIEALLLEPQS